MRSFHLFTLLNVSDEKLIDISEAKLTQACQSGICFSVEHKDSGKFIGFVVNEIMEKKNELGNYPFVELAQTHHLLDDLYEGFYEALNLEKFLFCGPVYVLEEYQNWGICKEMVKISQHVTVASGCEIKSGASANNNFTPSMLGLGYQIYKSVNLLEWRSPVTNEIVYKNAPMPHVNVDSIFKRCPPSMINNIPLKRTYMTSATASSGLLMKNAIGRNKKFAIPAMILRMRTLVSFLK